MSEYKVRSLKDRVAVPDKVYIRCGQCNSTVRQVEITLTDRTLSTTCTACDRPMEITL